MLKDILYKSDALYGLFTQKDFDFLKGTNDRQEELEFEIKSADLKRDKIVECIKKIEIDENSIQNIDKEELKKYIDNAQKAFDSVNTVIRNSTSLLDEFNDIEKEILEIVVNKESKGDTASFSKVEDINYKIKMYKMKQEQIKKENNEYNKIISNFLNDKEEKNNSKIDMKSVYKRIYEDIEIEDNLELIVSEHEKKVYLPYTKNEIKEFLINYPNEYKNEKDVIEQEFVTDITMYNKHPVLARFRESYSLCRNKEMKSAIDSLKFAMDMMFRSNINPVIIAAVKNQKQLETYIECLENNALDDFNYFTITFKVSPI